MTAQPASSPIRLGDLNIGRIGLGTNRLTDTPDNARFLAQALEFGLTLIDTADVYTNGESETTLGKYLAPFRKELVVATKGGIIHGQPPNASPAYLRQAVEASLRRLRCECIALYQLHRPDPNLPLTESVAALHELRQAGKIRHIGLSNVSLAQIESVRGLGPIAAIQHEYSLAERQRWDVLDYCQKQGIVFMAYFPLSLGDYHGPAVALANKYDATPIQIALAWLLSQADVMVPIPGTRSAAHLRENLAAADLKIAPADLALFD